MTILSVDFWVLILGISFIVIGALPFVAPEYYKRARLAFWHPKNHAMPDELAVSYEKYGRSLGMAVLGIALILHVLFDGFY